MRHLLLALLIALLPIRGWMGDAMALSSGTPAVTVVGHMDCVEHSAALHAALHSATDAAATPHADHGPAGEATHAHEACEVCNGPAMALDWPPGFHAPQVHAMSAAATVPFASTVLPQGIKPPIS